MVPGSYATPPGAPGMTRTMGPCGCRTTSAWGVAAPSSSSPPAPPATVGAARGHRCRAPVARLCPAPVRPRPRHPPAAAPRPLVGTRKGKGVKRHEGQSLLHHLAVPPRSPSPTRHGGGREEPGGARDAVSERNEEKTSHMGRVSLGSAVQGAMPAGTPASEAGKGTHKLPS